jgi:hypothetical protein
MIMNKKDSTEFIPGDKVIRAAWSDQVWEVVAVLADKVWIHSTENCSEGGSLDCIITADFLAKVEPMFETGKTYRAANPRAFVNADKLSFTVVSVNELWAVGWRSNNTPWTERQANRVSWEEVE